MGPRELFEYGFVITMIGIFAIILIGIAIGLFLAIKNETWKDPNVDDDMRV